MRSRRPLPIACLLLLAPLAAAQTPPAKPADAKSAADAAKLAKAAERVKKREEMRLAAEAAEKANRPTGPRASFPAAPPAKPTDPAAVARQIDNLLNARLKAENVAPSGRADDAEFLRRAALDITGVAPDLDRTRAFLRSAEPNKRRVLVEELLADPNYGRHQADHWRARLSDDSTANRFVPRQDFAEWLAKEFNQNTRWDDFTKKLVTASGTVGDNPAVIYFLMNRSADKITDTLTRHFLGIQLQCAQCHNHPFTEWKQSEYWQMAAFISKVNPGKPVNTNKGGDPNTVGVSELPARTKAKDFFPESAKELAPKYLGGPDANIPVRESYRPDLAAWMTSPANPWFAKAMANRTWSTLFGRGLVNPIDDMHDENPPTHPEVLDLLAAEFVKSGYDVKHLVRTLAMTEAYNRTSRPTPSNEKDETLYSHMPVRVMSPEQLHDTLRQISELAPARKKQAEKMREEKKALNQRDQFVNFFLAGAELPDATEYEAGIPQALRMMNSRQLLGAPEVVKAVVNPKATAPEALETLMLLTLNRRPTPEEAAKLLTAAKAAPTPVEGAGDLLWALVNSSEFTMIR